MKNKIILLLKITLMFAFQTQAQVNPRTVVDMPKVMAPIIPRITKINLVPDSSVLPNNPVIYYIKAIVYSVGKGTVEFKWRYQPDIGSSTAPHPFAEYGRFSQNGTGVDVIINHTIQVHSGRSRLEMKTITPNEITSNIVPY